MFRWREPWKFAQKCGHHTEADEERGGILAEERRACVCFSEVPPGCQVTSTPEKWTQSKGISCNYPDPRSCNKHSMHIKHVAFMTAVVRVPGRTRAGAQLEGRKRRTWELSGDGEEGAGKVSVNSRALARVGKQWGKSFREASQGEGSRGEMIQLWIRFGGTQGTSGDSKWV